MLTSLLNVTVIVTNQDEALAWYRDKLGLEKRTDETHGGFRYLSVGIPGQESPEIILQAPSVGHHGREAYERKLKQVGQGTTWVFGVDDLLKTTAVLKERGVKIVSEPKDFGMGAAVLIADLYGNIYTLLKAK